MKQRAGDISAVIHKHEPRARLRCQCVVDHDAVGTHPAFHPDRACGNYGTERLESSYGFIFTVCPPCASDALTTRHYWRA
jgi:hypothetical protein